MPPRTAPARRHPAHLLGARLVAVALCVLTACGRDGRSPDSAAAAPSRGGTVGPKTDRALVNGESRLAVDGGGIWYKVTGATTAGTPLLLLHGGPGYSSFYLKPLEKLADERPVVRYDQLGSGKSDSLSDTSRFTVAHYVDELEKLRAHLGVERMHLYGHAWGALLAVEYDHAHPERVASLTLASPYLDVPAWQRHVRTLVGTLSESGQRAIREAEAAQRFDGQAYQRARMELYGKYMWRRPVQADMDSTIRSVNSALYLHLLGPSELTITGTLKRYDARPLLKTIKVPTLFTVAEFDEADSATVRAEAALVPGSQVVMIPNSAHLTTWDNPAAVLGAVRPFLRDVDATTRSTP